MTPANLNREAPDRAFFCLGDRVEFDYGPKTHHGRITQFGATHHRIETDDGFPCAIRRTDLRPTPREES